MCCALELSSWFLPSVCGRTLHRCEDQGTEKLLSDKHTHQHDNWGRQTPPTILKNRIKWNFLLSDEKQISWKHIFSFHFFAPHTLFENKSAMSLTQGENLPQQNAIRPDVTLRGKHFVKDGLWRHPLQGEAGLCSQSHNVLFPCSTQTTISNSF